MLSPESVLAMPLLPFEGGFGFTPWGTSAQFSPPASWPQSPVQAQTQTQTQTQTHAAATPRSSGSEEPGQDRAASPAGDRRLRRMISNRESARRSRMRKQRHLEDLRGHVDQLKSQKRQLADRLVATTGHCLLFCRDNDRLRSEAAALRRRLLDIRRVLIFRHLQRVATAPQPACGGGFLPTPPGEQPALLAPPVYGGGFITETELIA